MDRFVALLWDSAIESRTQQVEAWSQALRSRSDRWAVVLDLPGLRVHSYHHRGDGPVVTAWPERNGVIIGPLFRRGEERRGRIKQFSTADAERIAASDGDALIRDWWGNYVAIWRKPGADNAVVIRDPCGAVPCFMTAQQDVQILFAHAEDVAALPDVHFSIDWTYLQAFLVFSHFNTAHTGLNEALELLPGQRASLTPHRPPLFTWAWHAVQVAAAPDENLFKETAEALRDIAARCFEAWGEEYPNIVVRLSGGLDSSVVLHLLKRYTSARITAFHLRGRGYEQFEDGLARLSALHAGVQLVEADPPPASADLYPALSAPVLARPLTQSLGVRADNIAATVAEEVGADAFMAGHGGDNLFLQRGGARHTLSDYIRLSGWNRDLVRVAYDAATIRRCGIWRILAESLSAELLRTAWRPYIFLDDPQFRSRQPLTEPALRSLPEDYLFHPWIDAARSLPHGAANHVKSITSVSTYYQRMGSALDRDAIHPLYSQPIVEFALRTPTYLLVKGGQDRALQRAAFSDLLPPAIVRRTGKGGIDNQTLDAISASLPFIRDLIMQGESIRKPWVNAHKVEQMLRPAYVATGGGAVYLYRLIAIEIWLRAWRCAATRYAG